MVLENVILFQGKFKKMYKYIKKPVKILSLLILSLVIKKVRIPQKMLDFEFTPSFLGVYQ